MNPCPQTSRRAESLDLRIPVRGTLTHGLTRDQKARALLLAFLVAGATRHAAREMNEVIVWARWSHGAQAPVAAGGADARQPRLGVLRRGAVGVLRSEALAGVRRARCAHCRPPSSSRAGIAIHLPGGEQNCAIHRNRKEIELVGVHGKRCRS